MFFRVTRAGWAGLLVVLMDCSFGWSQSTGERHRFQLRIGASYDQGNFGTSETTKVLFAPITLRYLGERFDLGITPSFARVNNAGEARLIGGLPAVTGGSSTPDARSTAGDTVIHGHIYLLEEDTLNVTPFARVKIPSSRENTDFGTGRTDYGFGVEIDKLVSAEVLLFGDLSYTLIGNIPGMNLRDRMGGSVGVGRSISGTLFLSGLLDWRQALVAGNQDPTDLVGIVTYRLKPAIAISPHAFVGLTDSSPDFGIGMEISLRFGPR
jgi:hypothetical protein